MKNFLLVVYCVIQVWGVTAQIPTIVNDPMNYGQLGEVIIQAEEQIAKAEEQITFAKKMEERVTVVTSAVKTTQMAIDVVDRGNYCIDRINSLTNTMQSYDGLSSQYVAMCTKRCTQASTSVISCMKLVENVLGGGFKMSDNERLQQMQENLDAINLTAIQINALDMRTERLARRIKLLK